MWRVITAWGQVSSQTMVPPSTIRKGGQVDVKEERGCYAEGKLKQTQQRYRKLNRLEISYIIMNNYGKQIQIMEEREMNTLGKEKTGRNQLKLKSRLGIAKEKSKWKYQVV